jgi:hypothetical protein
MYIFIDTPLRLLTNEASDGTMSYSAELKLHLEHVDKLEFNVLRKNSYVLNSIMVQCKHE